MAADREYDRLYRQRWREAHPERNAEIAKASATRLYKQDPVKHRQRVAAARYGLSVPEYQALIARGICDACGRASAKLQIDHCHETGRIRGVLCPNCNSALGHAGDNADRLRALIAYLDR